MADPENPLFLGGGAIILTSSSGTLGRFSVYISQNLGADSGGALDPLLIHKHIRFYSDSRRVFR